MVILFSDNIIRGINRTPSVVLTNVIIRLIPLETVDNNLGPDRLTGPKALDPYYCRQTTL